VLRVLGPLEAKAGDAAVELGGRKQQAVLAALLLRAGEVVPDDRLIDDVWGEQPPAAVGHSLEAYVSNLRRVLAPYGIVFERRGGGYRLDLGAASLDARAFEALVEQATDALAAGDRGWAASAAGEALSLWHGPVLAGTPLHRDGRAEAERLEELRARAFEIRVDADLALGRHADVVADLGSAVEADPYRQRLVAQLMIALYRTGRHAEALDVYERTRRALDSDLGLQPSEDLQRLAGQIVRQEPGLRAPAGTIDVREGRRAERRRRAPALAVVLLLAAAAIALGLVVASGGVAVSHEGPVRVALIRMWNPLGPAGADEAGWRPFVDGLLAAERTYGIETEIVDLFPRRPPRGGFEPGSPEDVHRLSERLKAGDFDLVLWPQGLTGPNFYAVVPENPDTRFAFLDFCCVRDVVVDSRNTTTITLRADQAAHLAGYLSGLMEARRPLVGHRRHTVSMILGEPGFPQERVYGQGFLAGVRRALPNATVLTDYSHDYDDRSTCESIANQQIDAGSGVVFAVAGECGVGALAAAGIRGVWGVGADEDRMGLGPHMLASATKRFDRLTELSVSWYLEGRLPAGEDIELGIADDAVALVSISPQVPLSIRRKVAHEAALLRSKDEASGSS
jgi:DNA-binding SARP family transcriptional activator/basic membrane lipoprotein Med (substrate-binding protein (PBP1-ABC) superfamily)